MKPVDVSDATFEAQVLKNSLPTLVDFWAPWCGPCKMVSPIVEELAKEYDGRVYFAKLNTDDNVATAMRYGIRGIPTLLIFKNGREVGRIVGYMPKAELKKRLEAALATPVSTT